jgi:hypothetical protein
MRLMRSATLRFPDYRLWPIFVQSEEGSVSVSP